MVKILIIDDESITRQWIKKKVEDISADYSVVGVFSNGRQAFEYCKKESVDVIFTDIREDNIHTFLFAVFKCLTPIRKYSYYRIISTDIFYFFLNPLSGYTFIINN